MFPTVPAFFLLLDFPLLGPDRIYVLLRTPGAMHARLFESSRRVWHGEDNVLVPSSGRIHSMIATVATAYSRSHGGIVSTVGRPLLPMAFQHLLVFAPGSTETP